MIFGRDVPRSGFECFEHFAELKWTKPDDAMNNYVKHCENKQETDKRINNGVCTFH